MQDYIKTSLSIADRPLRPSDYNPSYFWIVIVQDRSIISFANAVRPLIFSKVIDLDKLLVKRSKRKAAFSIIIE